MDKAIQVSFVAIDCALRGETIQFVAFGRTGNENFLLTRQKIELKF